MQISQRTRKPFRASRAHRLPKSGGYVSATGGQVKAERPEKSGVLALQPRPALSGLLRKPGYLALDQFCIDPLPAQQHRRRSLFTDFARAQHSDPIEAPETRQTMRYGKDGATSHQPIQCRAYRFLRFRIERRGRLIEQQDRSVLEKSTRDAQTLTLPRGEFYAPLAYDSIETFGKGTQEIHAVGGHDRVDNFSVRCVRTSVPNVLDYRTVKKRDVLWDEGNRASQALLRNL